MDGADLMESSDELAPVPGLDRMETRDTIRDILHVSAGEVLAGHLLDTERNCCYPQPVGCISAKWHCTRSTDNREGTIGSDSVNHPGNSLFVRADADIVLCCRLPGTFIAGCYAVTKKWSEFRVNHRMDNESLGPDHFRIERITEMVRELFAYRIPVRFSEGIISFVIIPDRARVHPHQFRDCDMLPVLCQDYSPYNRGELIGLYLLKCSCREGQQLTGYLSNQGFHTRRANLIIMTSQEISVNIPPTLDPVYSNMIQIAYKDDEFTFMFLHQLPQVNQARAKAIVSITPNHAKNLLAVLTKTVADFESKFGTIAPPKDTKGNENVTALSGYS
jgi:hypothetical protein